MRSNHIVERTCVGCGLKTSKWDLLRLVKTPMGTIEVDPHEGKPGRGAYLCSRRSCWDAGLKGNRLGNALRTSISMQERNDLLHHVVLEEE